MRCQSPKRVALVIGVQAVVRAVGARHEDRRPDDRRRDVRRHRRGRDVGDRDTDLVADAPRMIARRDPRVVGELDAVTVDVDPTVRGADVVVARDVGVDAASVAGAMHLVVLEHGGHDAFEDPLERHRLRVVRRRARSGCDASVRAPRSCIGPTAVVSPSAPSSRLARTVHCSVPRDTPAYASITPRFGYLPSPKPSEIEPSLAAAIAQIFSVQDRSDCETVANVSTIWWARSSSSGPSGPRSVTAHRSLQLRSRM